jgi:hypothetical protein
MHLLGAFSSKSVTLTFECVVAEALGDFAWFFAEVNAWCYQGWF